MDKIRFLGAENEISRVTFGSILKETREKTTVENEDTLLSCAINGIFRNDELFSHFRGSSTIGYIKVKKNDLILSAQNLHLGNANVNLRFEHGIISPAYKVYRITGAEPEYIAQWVKRPAANQFFLAATTEGASQCRKNIDWDALYRQSIVLPSSDEQKKIAKLLMSLDSQIAFEKTEVRKLKDFKSAMLTKMFPKEGKTEPEIRFPGFTDAWEQRKLDEAFDFTVPNNTLSRAELNQESGSVRNIHYGDVLIKYGSVLDAQNDELPFITGRSKDDFKGALLQNGDIIIADTAEDETTGKVCEIVNIQDKDVVAGLHTMVCRPKNKTAEGYFGYYMNSSSYHHQLLPLMQGIKVLSLSKTNVQKTTVKYPKDKAEQQKIVDFLRRIDALITLHQRKHEKLIDTKKAFLEKLIGGEK